MTVRNARCNDRDKQSRLLSRESSLKIKIQIYRYVYEVGLASEENIKNSCYIQTRLCSDVEEVAGERRKLRLEKVYILTLYKTTKLR